MSRRTFVAAASAVTAAALAQSQSSQSSRAAKPLRILILGGTGFIGPYQVRYAVDRGHKVTVFNRGKTNPNSVPVGVERLQGEVWIPPVGDMAGFGTHSIKKALAAGLTFRSLADTVQATLDYHESRDAERKAKFRAGIKPEREAEVLAAWKAQKK